MKHVTLSLCALVAAVLIHVSVTSAQAAVDDKLPGYACTFSNGGSWTQDAGVFATATGAPLSFKISKISRKARSAELTTDTGRTDLKLVAAIDALHFIEVTVSGYLTLTTIYGDGKRVPAVHSRHLGIVGQPVGGQLTGFCDRL